MLYVYCLLLYTGHCTRNNIVDSLLPFTANKIVYLVIFVCTICSLVYLKNVLKCSEKTMSVYCRRR